MAGVDVRLHDYVAEHLLYAGVPRGRAMAEANKAIAMGELEHHSIVEISAAIEAVYGPDGDATRATAQPGPDSDDASDSDDEGLRGLFLDLSADVGVPSEPLRHVVRGLLPREHVAQIVAKGGSGKTFLAYELMFAVATGGEWLGFECERGRVLFVDPELHPDLIRKRVRDVTCALGLAPSDVAGMFDVLPLRGHVATADGITNLVTDEARDGRTYDLIIIDSINAVLTGDENSSTDVRGLFAALQRLTAETHAAGVVMHHTGKGAGKAEGERGRGSSVFLDGPDECMELVPLRVEDGTGAAALLATYGRTYPGGERVPATAWRMTFPKHRSGPPIRPLDAIFSHPLHHVDATGELAECRVVGSDADNGSKGGERRAARCAEDLRATDEALGRIVADLTAEGTVPTRAACLGPLNEWREAHGMEPWAESMFTKETRPSGRLSWHPSARAPWALERAS